MPTYMPYMKLLPYMMWPEMLYTNDTNVGDSVDDDNKEDDSSPLYRLQWPKAKLCRKFGYVDICLINCNWIYHHSLKMLLMNKYL